MDENTNNNFNENTDEITTGNSTENEQITEETNSYSEVKEKNMFLKEVFEWSQAIVVAVVIAMFLRTFIFTLVKVSGPSMVPTLQNNDKLFVWRLGYEPNVGDIIIFKPKGHEDTPYVKRVIATAGQTVDLKYDKLKGYCEVFVDGQIIDEAYINEKIDLNHMGSTTYPAIVPENCVFAMGDNRNNSKDSRYKDVGMVTEDSIIGHAVFRLWPVGEFGTLD